MTCDPLRASVRRFVDETRDQGLWEPLIDGWFFGFSRAFSEAMGARGWIGMTWPVEHGGGGRSPLERFVVIEELLAAGAPMNAHWVSDRQTGPSLLRYGTDAQRARFLPEMAAGRLVTALGMSEPAAGSDLAAVETTGRRVPGGWRLSGTKIWTGNAHRADLLVVLARTREGGHRSEALSQFLVTLPDPAVRADPIPTASGHRHFCRVILDDVFVPEDMLLGVEGAGWRQVTAELGDERGGPERYLSLFPVMEALGRAVSADAAGRLSDEFGLLMARLSALRALAVDLLDEGSAQRLPRVVRAAAFKSAATRFEAEALELTRRAARTIGLDGDGARLLDEAAAVAPAAGLRGGTTQIMEGIVARGLS